MKKVLVVGGAGYIGSHILYELINNNYEIYVLDNFSTGILENVAPEIIKNVFNTDILDTAQLDKIFNEVKPDSIIHMAALKSVGDSFSKITEYSNANLVGLINILNMCIKYNVKNIIFSSSCSIFGNIDESIITETTEKNPISFYGFTKYIGEQLLEQYSKLGNFNYISLRYFNVAGYDIYNRIKYPEANPTTLIPIMMEVLTGKRDILYINGNDYNTKDGTCIRDYIHVTDIAKAHTLALKKLEKSPNNYCLNLGNSIGISIFDIINKINELLNIKFPYKIRERRNGDPAVALTDNSMAKDILGWKPLYSDINTILTTTFKVYNI